MNTTQSLLEFILNLLRDSDAKAAFVADPQKALADAGLSEVCREDVSDAMSYIAEYHPVTFVGTPEYHPEPLSVSPHPTSDHPDHSDEPDHSYRPGPHASAVHQLEYITNNYSYTDSHDTVIDKSVHEHIWNDGTLEQRFDDHSVTATDHSVATGRDINGSVADGNNNVLGDGNSVGNTTHSDNHSVRDSFNGNNIADHGGVAGHDNDGNATNPHNSNVATGEGSLENSPYSRDTTNRDSFNDSHNQESHRTTTLDSHNDESHHDDSYHDNSHHSGATDSFNHQSFNGESFNHDLNNDESYNHDSAITHTDQHGLINASLVPEVTIPVHHNELDVLTDHDHHLPA